MYLDRTKEFREEAFKRGLLLSSDAERPAYYFNLNQGPFSTSQALDVVWEVLKLAREYADSDDLGEHVSMLALMAKKSNLGRDYVCWHRPHQVPGNSDSREEWISLLEFLTEEGYNPKELYQDKGYTGVRNTIV